MRKKNLFSMPTQAGKTSNQPKNARREMRQPITELLTSEVQRKRAEQALIESEARYKALLESCPDGILIADIETLEFKYANPAMCRTLGYGEKELKRMGVMDIHPEENLEHVIREFKAQAKGEKSLAEDIPCLRKDGIIIYADINAVKNLIDGRECNIGFFRDITERKKVDEQIMVSLKEKEVLLKEIHHRVKNNLQIISSLLKLQSQYIKDERYIEMFKESQNRIKSMAFIHENLYKSRDLTKIDFKKYIKTLAKDMFQTYSVSPGKLKLNIETEDVYLKIDKAIPCGLIINELVSNSLKHAFPDGQKGVINIAFHSINEKDLELVVSDNGVGIPRDLDFRKTKSLGLHLVTILAESQLHGEIKLDRKKGTKFQIKLRDMK